MPKSHTKRVEKRPKAAKRAARKAVAKTAPRRRVGKAVPKRVQKKVQRTLSKKERAPRQPKAQEPVEPPQNNERIKEIVKDDRFGDYLSKKVGKRAVEVLMALETPQTDEKIAEMMGVKVNEVRRMLNVLNSHSVVRYDVNKDSKGWLTFMWYIDRGKIVEIGEDVIARHGRVEHRLPENCNDFFVCNKCYGDQKIVLPFETAFEMSFKCECGDKLRQISRVEAENLFHQDGKVL